jgi:hypothetical protein
VDHLKQFFERDETAIAYISCSYKEQDCQTDSNLITRLLQQLAQTNPLILNKVSLLYRDHIEKQTRPTLNEWSILLQSEAGRFSEIFMIIDALDECSDYTRESLLSVIQKLPNIHLLVTSRHILTIEREFKGKFENTTSVEIRASDEDVRRYLENRIKREHRLASHVEADPTLKETIINTIAEKTKGI